MNITTLTLRLVCDNTMMPQYKPPKTDNVDPLNKFFPYHHTLIHPTTPGTMWKNKFDGTSTVVNDNKLTLVEMELMPFPKELKCERDIFS